MAVRASHGSLLPILNGPSSIFRIILHPNRQIVRVVGIQGSGMEWNLSTGVEKSTTDHCSRWEPYSPNSKWLYVGGILSTSDGAITRKLCDREAHERAVFSADSARIAIADLGGNTIRVYQTDDGKLLFKQDSSFPPIYNFDL